MSYVRPIHFWYTLLSLVSCLSSTSYAQPPIVDGLILRLDAQQLAETQTAGAVAVWENQVKGLGDFEQSQADSQPEVVKLGELAVVRFDGENDHMRSLANQRAEVPALTVFAVLAARNNIGDFRGLISASRAGERDYESGFNLDLGPSPSRKLDFVNAEGRGFGGARNLLQESYAFGRLHVLTLRVDAEQKSVDLRIDGKACGQREYLPQTLSLEELTLAARSIPNLPDDKFVHGELKCDMAEILLYERALSADELSRVENYLLAKHAELTETLPQTLADDSAAVLAKVENPPAIQMLIPGFEVHELPVALTNVNNVRFRGDGKLITLGYNGDVHLLSDTDGDGLEDDAQLFWKNEGSLRGPIGMLVTPEGYPRGRGIFTPSKGKLSLIVDTDGDDRADEEIVVASGWNEITPNVDATGIAMDKDGNLYFGLGTANYANAYLVNDEGQAEYDLHSDRGTVQRISPDFKTRETLCTGIRFPIAFAFNKQGDLFCTEQEGATWLPNGNPLDELLHIVPDRHYGFPPRHPRHNPDVIDEPSVFDYSPQHQSTCGMVFDEPVNGGPVFGPAWWADNALVCGESRGKLWRTQLAKTQAGYVASTQLIACLQMLTVDGCVAPNGDFVVACHSGPPDWGTGPTGMGKLFRIHMSNAHIARPVATWANSPHEIQIAFDSPVEVEMLRGIADKIAIQFGEYIRAGDQFETLIPPYAVVQKQLTAPRQNLTVRGISLSADRRNVLLQTDAMHSNSHYAISIPYEPPVPTETPTENPSGIQQVNSLDMDLTLGGVEAQLYRRTGLPLSGQANDASLPANSSTGSTSSATQSVTEIANELLWNGWLPHLDWKVSDEFTRHSAAHDQLRALLPHGGELALHSRLDLLDILRPKVQPGSTLDYEWPAEIVTLVARATHPMVLICDQQPIEAKLGTDGRYEARFEVPREAATSFPLIMRIHIDENSTSEKGTPDWSVTVSTNEDPRPRALPLRRFSLPWTAEVDAELANETQIEELAGGSWGLGRRVFHSEAASCFKCHAIHGSGPSIGPDLTNLVHRDYASVLRDIQHPSYAINPDYLGQVVLLQDGRVLTGVLQTREGELYLGDALGNVTHVSRSEIESIKAAEVSIMPTGIAEKLSAEQFRDLMTFLLTAPPHMPLDSPLKAPPLRTRAEVAAVLADSQPLPADLKQLRIVLVAGEKDHGPGEHDYPAWQLQWGQLLAASDKVQVEAAWDFPSETQMKSADVLIFFQKGDWDDKRQRQMDAFFERGGGGVYIHWAVNGNDRVEDFSQRIGLASRGGSIGYRHGPLSLQVHNTDHPIMRNVEPLQLYDESYWRLTGETQAVTLFASSMEDGAPQPQLWAYERAAGRAFVSIPGHYNWTFDDPIFRTILLRGIAWTAQQPVDRFNELVPLGARLAN